MNTRKSMKVHGFDPIARYDAKILILGTIPGPDSLKAKQYYANKRNAFWPIIFSLLTAKGGLDYESKVELLKRNHIAVWDVLQSCHREGSLDSKIQRGTERPNDFRHFFDSKPDVRSLFFNGKEALILFRRLVLPGLANIEHLPQLTLLPSTSSANTHLTQKGKLEKWEVIKKYIR